MCALTLTKARRAARDHTRQKRGISSEQYLDSSATDSVGNQMQLSGDDVSPLSAAMVSDQLGLLLESLNSQRMSGS